MFEVECGQCGATHFFDTEEAALDYRENHPHRFSVRVYDTIREEFI